MSDQTTDYVTRWDRKRDQERNNDMALNLRPKCCSPSQFAFLGHFECFSRNGRWGTCGDCPITSEGKYFPEFCPNTDRYDHQLTAAQLVEGYDRRK